MKIYKYVYYHDSTNFQIYKFLEKIANSPVEVGGMHYTLIYSNVESEVGDIGYIQKDDIKHEDRFTFSNNLKELKEQFMLDML